MINNIDLADSLKFQYSTNKPFPYIVIDNFFNEQLLNSAVEELKQFNDWGMDGESYVESHQVNKLFTPWDKESYNNLYKFAPTASFVLSFLNSDYTLKYLERLTGIQNLLADHELNGGGVHRISTGGKLDVHIDFNWSEQLEAHRRINLLLYLNKDWNPEWGGNLELWENGATEKSVDISPIFNRAVIFNITDEAYHGHPIPLNTPPEIARYSFALYYFTKERPQHEITDPHCVVWK